MHHSQFVTEFTIESQEKGTPTTASPLSPISPCPYCKHHLAKVSDLRKGQIQLELRNEQLKSQVEELKRSRDELINQKILTYHQYQQRLQCSDGWNREDLQAQLFEAKVIIQLLLTSKAMPNHHQIKELDSQALKDKYSNLLLQHLRLQQKLIVKDRIIQEKVFFPIYHYDQRVMCLRKAMVHWYRKAEEECVRMKRKCKDLKQNLNEQVQTMRQVMNNEIQKYRSSLSQLNEGQKRKLPKEQKRQRKQREQAKKVEKDSWIRVQSKKIR